MPTVDTIQKPRAADWREYPALDIDAVLTAAVAAFNEFGYHGSTVRDIAQRCGLSVAGIYHHHNGKQDMLVSILDLVMGEMDWRSEGALEEAGEDPVRRFELLIESMVLVHTHRRDLAAIGASEMRSLTPENRQRIAHRRTYQQRLVDAEVERAVAARMFTTEYPHESSRAVVTMCTSLTQWFRAGGPQSPEDLAIRYVGISLDAMGFHRA